MVLFLIQQLPKPYGQMYYFLIKNNDASIDFRCWSNKMNMLLEACNKFFWQTMNKKQVE